jgi:hypothetical protein
MGSKEEECSFPKKRTFFLMPLFLLRYRSGGFQKQTSHEGNSGAKFLAFHGETDLPHASAPLQSDRGPKH